MSSYSAFCQRLFRQNEFSVKLGIDRLRRALDVEGAPHKTYASLHVAGTNGKGSVASMCHAGLLAIESRVGLYTSPHLVDVRERIRVDGEPITKKRFLDLGSYVLDRWSESQQLEERLTYFEILTLIAALHFKHEGVDVAVFEVGLGGRLDATNAIDTALAVITPVALDHTRHLGNDIESVLGEKLGILRPEKPAVVCRPDGWDDSKLRNALRQVSASPILIEGDDFWREEGTAVVLGDEVPLDWLNLAGTHQMRNATCALAALALWRQEVDPRLPPVTKLCHSVARARWPGRWQQVMFGDTTLIVDGAHNPHAAQAVAATIRKELREPVTVVFGVSKNKDLEAIFRAIAPVVAEVICVPVDNPRAESPEHNAAAAARYGLRSRVAPSLEVGVQWAEETNRPIVSLGSLYLAGEILDASGHTAETLKVLEQPAP